MRTFLARSIKPLDDFLRFLNEPRLIIEVRGVIEAVVSVKLCWKGVVELVLS